MRVITDLIMLLHITSLHVVTLSHQEINAITFYQAVLTASDMVISHKICSVNRSLHKAIIGGLPLSGLTDKLLSSCT
jgi:hypothetical protein